MNAVEGPRNLLVNSGLETDRDRDGRPEGWTVDRSPNGVTIERDGTRARSGRFSLKMAATDEAEVTWYIVRQTVPSLVPQEQYVLSAFVRTDHVRDGAGAYLGVNFYGLDQQRFHFQDSDKRTGSQEWTRLALPFTVPNGTARADVGLVLHGHGTAWFDDVQLEVGPVATEYAPREEDLARAARAAMEFERREKGNVAILRDLLPATPGGLDPDLAAEVARSLDYGVCFLTAQQLSSPLILHPVNFDLLILPYGAAFPADAVESLRAFLRLGGDFLVLGGYPFDELGLLLPSPSYEGGDQGGVREGVNWTPIAELPYEGMDQGTPLFDLSAAGVANWKLGPAPGERASLTLAEEGVGFRLSDESLARWASANSPPVAALPPEAEATLIETRGSREGLSIFFEWDEKDGSRWRKRLVVGQKWQWVGVTHRELEYWHDNPSVGRGGPEDRFHPENAAHCAFGLTSEVLATDQPYWIEVRRIVAGRDRYAGLRHLQVNSRRGETTGATFLAWPPEAITVCDPAQPLDGVVVARTAEGQCALREALTLAGPLTGFSASGQIGTQWWSSENRARWTPLISCFDALGQLRGTALGLIENYRGEYPGSSWAYSAVTDRPLFSPEAPASAPALRQLLTRLVRGVYLYESQPQQHCFREGETPALVTHVANFGRTDFAGAVRVRVSPDQLGPPGGAVLAERSQDVRVAAGDAATLTFEWPAETFERELYPVEVTLLENGAPIDMQRTGLAFWREEVVRQGVRVSYEGGVLAFDGRPQFAIGTQGYWGNISVTATDPLVIDEDFRRLADAGMRVCRIFMSLGERDREDRWRLRDLYLLLAQRHGVAVFMEGLSRPTADPARLEEDGAFAAQAARRYAEVPGLFLDIANEPALRLPEEPEVRQAAFARWLAARYGTEAAWREAWGREADGLAWGQVPLATTNGPWESCRAADADELCAQLMRDWAGAVRAAVRAVDPDRLVSVGQLQGAGWGEVAYDPIVGSYDMDFTNRHYYGPVSGFLPQFREIDQRVRGAAPSVGEFGATEHPAFTAHYAYDTHAGRFRRFQTIPFAAFGSGGLFACSWHWRDPIETVFPCGLVFADGADKPLLPVYRNVGILLRQMEPRSVPPEVYFVLPLRHRRGGSKAAATGACAQAVKGLLSARVDFGTLGEDGLPFRPPLNPPQLGGGRGGGAGGGGQAPPARLLVYPCPYCPPDETMERLAAFVRQGGVLYLSGDLSYAPDRRRTRTDRLETLCGVRFVEEIFPNVAYVRSEAPKGQPAVDEPLTGVAEAIAAAPSIASPGLRVAPTTATVLATAGADPLAVANRVGQGWVVAVFDPVELHDPTDPGLLRALCDLAGVARHPLIPDRPEVQSMTVHGPDGAVGHVVLNTSDQPVRLTFPTEAGEVRLEIPGQCPGFVLERKGQVAAALGTSCEVSGQPLFSSPKQLGVILADEAVVLLPLDEGEFDVQVAAPGLGASPILSLGEFRARQWTELARRPVDGQGTFSIRLRPPEERCIGVLVPATQADSAARVAEALR